MSAGSSSTPDRAGGDWSLDRVEFAALPDPPLADSGALGNAYGGRGKTLFARPQERWESLNLEFLNGSARGWAEYLDGEVVDCGTNSAVSLPGKAILLVHFEGAFRDERFVENNLAGGSVILDACQICGRDGVLEWAIGVAERKPFHVDVYRQTEGDFEYSVVSVDVLR